MASTDPLVVIELRKVIHALDKIKARFYLLTNIQDELDQRPKRATVTNDHVWAMVLDLRLGLNVDLASLAKSVYRKGGLFGHLNAARNLLTVPTPTSPKVRRLARNERYLFQGRRAAFVRLFPAATSRSKASAEDVAHQQKRFRGVVKRMINDRDKTLAHMYEKHAVLDRTILTPRQYAPVFEHFEALTNDLQLVIMGGTHDFRDISMVDTAEVARDIVDMVLGGTVQQLAESWGVNDRLHQSTGQYFWQLREAHQGKRQGR